MKTGLNYDDRARFLAELGAETVRLRQDCDIELERSMTALSPSDRVFEERRANLAKLLQRRVRRALSHTRSSDPTNCSAICK